MSIHPEDNNTAETIATPKLEKKASVSQILSNFKSKFGSTSSRNKRGIIYLFIDRFIMYYQFFENDLQARRKQLESGAAKTKEILKIPTAEGFLLLFFFQKI